MTSRERVEAALAHREPDRVPVDLGSTGVTGMAASVVAGLRQRLGLDSPGTPVRVVELYQMLGEIGEDLREALGIDCIGLRRRKNMFGFENKDWKPWRLFDGTPVLVPGQFNTGPDSGGDILMYPEGDRSAPPSGRMPKGGYYFDAIVRQEPIDESRLNPADNLEEFKHISDEELDYLRRQAEELYRSTDLAIVGGFGGTSFGDIALVPAPSLKKPKGIRDIEEWYISSITRKAYVFEVYEKQCEIGLANLEKIRQAVGDRPSVVFVTGTDFGTQRAPFIRKELYRELYKPFHKRVNDWVHSRTRWRTFIHSCGSVEALIPDFIDAGFDILNPVQCSAAGMDPQHLKRSYGRELTLWGGGVDTQNALPFGSTEGVSRQVSERVRVFGEGGGYVFTPIHNVQARTPVENVLAMFEALGRAF